MLNIRTAEPSDIPVLASVFQQVREESFSWQKPKPYNFSVQTEGELIHLAEDDQHHVLGFISVWEPESFIHHLYVLPEHQRKGIGKQLIASIREKVPYPYRLKCLKRNKAGLNFYQKNGWWQVGEGMDEEEGYWILELTRNS